MKTINFLLRKFSITVSKLWQREGFAMVPFDLLSPIPSSSNNCWNVVSLCLRKKPPPVSSGSGRKVICLAFILFYIFPSVFWASTQPLVLPTPIRLPFTPGLSRTARWSHNLLSTSWSTSLISILGFLWKNSLLNLPIMKSSPRSKQWIDL